MAAPVTRRSPAEIEALFGGLPLVAPGLVPAVLWRAKPWVKDLVSPILAGVARALAVVSSNRADGAGTPARYR